MNVDSIKNGIVIDHITPGRAMEIYRLLGLEELGCPIAIIRNAGSKKMGSKDIIKIDADIELSTDTIGYIDAGITVNVIRDGKIVQKKQISLPTRLVDVIRCKNPRCITSTEQELAHIFELTDKNRGVYRCLYCEAQAKQ